MKKNILYTALCMAQICLLGACSDFLNEQPQSDFTNDGSGGDGLTSKYLNLADAEAELQGAYENFKSDIFQMENYTINDIQSDNCYVGGDGTNEEAVGMLRLSPTNAKVSLVWSQYYSMSGTATNVIENTRLMESAAIQEADRNRIMAEAKFIRTWACFDMVRLWGDLPMVTQLIPTITAENLEEWYPVMYPERTPEEEIYRQIIDDLDEAGTIRYLESMNKGAFQATKGAAYGLLAKVWATRGEKSSRNYSEVIRYCDKAIAEGYRLTDRFEELWDPDNKFTPESMFEVYYTTDAPNWAYWTLLKEADGTVSWRRYCTPSHDLIAKYDTEKDQRYASGILWKEAPYDVYYPADNYPFAYKIREKNSDIILMRLADILLLKAEALVEMNQVAEAIEIVNQVRRRAGLDGLPLGMSQSEARLAVENERQLELFMEGQRWYDLLRNERMLEVMRNHRDAQGNLFLQGLEAYRAKWPLPQGEMDKNTRLVQNEGY